MAKKEEESRLAQILRQELKAGRGLVDALSNSYKERQRERNDFRKYFPKGGVAGLALQSMFGKPYQYGNRKAAQQQAAQTKTQTTNLSYTKKLVSNTSDMARDMRIMKINMIRFVSAMGKMGLKDSRGRPLKPYNESDKKTKIQPKGKSSSAAGSRSGGGGGGVLGQVVGGLFGAASFATDVAGGIVRNLVGFLGSGFKIGAGILGGLASVLGSVVGGVLSVGGGIVGGLFRGIAGAISGMGLMGVIALAGVGFLAYRLSQSITGELNFDTVSQFLSDKLKSFFGMKEGETFKDVIYNILGKVDEKTGLNTTGGFEFLERMFTKWFTYSTSVMSQVVDVIKDIGKLSLLEMHNAFLKFGTMIVTLVSELSGIFLGGKAMVGVGSALASGMLMRGAGAGIAGGNILGAVMTFAGAVGMGALGGKLLGDRISESINSFMVTNSSGLTDEQRRVLQDMQDPDSQFYKDMNSLSTFTKGYNEMNDKDPMKATYKNRIEKLIGDVKHPSAISNMRDRFERAFGVQFDPNKSVTQNIIDKNQKSIDEINEKLGKTSVQSVREQADIDSSIAEDQKFDEQERRRAQRVPNQSSGETSGSQLERLRALIARGESSGDYDIINKKEGGKYKAYKQWKITGAGTLLSESSLNEVLRELYSERIHAAGKYQFIGSTLSKAMKVAGIPGTAIFNKETQDKLADAWIKETIKDAKTPEEKQKALAKQWAALEYEGGKSYYEGKHNRASVWANEIQDVFRDSTNAPKLATVEPKVKDVIPPQGKDFSEIFMEEFDKAFGTNFSIESQKLSIAEQQLKLTKQIADNTKPTSGSDLRSDDPNAKYVPYFSRSS